MKMKNILLAFTLLGSLTSLLGQSAFETQEKKTAVSALKDAKHSQQKHHIKHYKNHQQTNKN